MEEKCMTFEEAKQKINKYGNLSFLPAGWAETDARHQTLKKLNINFLKFCKGYQSSGKFSKPILANIVMHEDLKKIAQHKEDEEKKISYEQENLKKLLVPHKIAEAIYSVSKEAKRQRDIKCRIASDIYEDGVRCDAIAHYQVSKAKNKARKLYFLKNLACEKAIKDYKLKPVGYHSFPSFDLLYYKFCDYSFHYGEPNSISQNAKYLGKIDDKITAKRARCMPPKKAITLLNLWIDN